MLSKIKQELDKLPLTAKIIVASAVLALVIPHWLIWITGVLLVLFVLVRRKKFGKDRLMKYSKLIALGAFTLMAVAWAEQSVKAHIENSRTYYINTAESVTFDCNARYVKESDEVYCQTRTLTGEFSSYDTVYLDNASANGNKFTKDIYGSIWFKNDDFSINDASENMTYKEDVYLKNKVLNRTVSHKTIKVHYELSEQDKNLVTQKHNEWKAAEAKRKSEEAARKQALEEAELRKKEEEQRKADESSKAKEQNSADDSQTTRPTTAVNPDEDDLFEAEVTCQQYAETYFNVKDVNMHYDQASIRKRNPDGTLIIKAQIADSQGFFRPEKPLGMMECTTTSDGMQVTNFVTY